MNNRSLRVSEKAPEKCAKSEGALQGGKVFICPLNPIPKEEEKRKKLKSFFFFNYNPGLENLIQES